MKYLFYISKEYSISIIKPLVKELNRRRGDYAFYVSHKVQKNVPKEWENVYTALKKAKEFNPDFVLCPGNFVDFRIPGVKVQVFHGLGIEKPVHYKIRHFFDIFLTSGPYVTQRFQQLQKKYHYFDLLETGWPKVDYIINFPTEKIHQQYDIPEDKTVILYAPTFSSSMESTTELMDIIPKTIQDDEYWIFKFHELMAPELIQQLTKKLPQNVNLIKSGDITPYLHLADIMISDTSSVIYEFIVLNKPVITYKTIDRKDKGIDIISPNHLRAAIDRYRNHPKLHEKRRKKHIAEINPAVAGNISKQVIDKLEMIDPTLYPKNGKPLNLFRKSQIIYHSIFRKGYLR